MNIHITLMGGQKLPVYKGILESEPDKVYIIHTSETTENVRAIRTLIDVPVEMVCIEATDYPAIREKTAPLFTGNNTYTVNISGGTKIMSLALYQEAEKIPEAAIFYLDQNDLILDLRALTTSACKKSVSIDKLFELAGNPLKSYRRLQDYSPNEKKIPEKVRQMIAFAPREFFALLNEARKNINETSFITRLGSSYRLLSPQRLEITLKNRYGQKKKKCLKSITRKKWCGIPSGLSWKPHFYWSRGNMRKRFSSAEW